MPAETKVLLRAEREDARRWAVRLEGMLRRAQEALASRTLLMERAEADRDTALARLATCAAETTIHRKRREQAQHDLAVEHGVLLAVAAELEEVLAALAELVEAVAAVQLSDLPHEELVAAIGLPLPLGRRIVERYRRAVVPADAHKTD